MREKGRQGVPNEKYGVFLLFLCSQKCPKDCFDASMQIGRYARMATCLSASLPKRTTDGIATINKTFTNENR